MIDDGHLAGLIAACDFNMISVPTLDAARWLRAQGVDIGQALNIGGPIIEHDVAATGDGLFDFAAPGEPGAVRAIVQVVNGDDAETPVDLIAWTRDRPERMRLRLGTGIALGVDQIRNPASYFAGKPLRIYRSPLGWLRAGCEGIVVLDVAGVIDRLGGLPPRPEAYKLLAEDVDHGRDLRPLLAPLRPQVRLYVPHVKSTENAA